MLCIVVVGIVLVVIVDMVVEGETVMGVFVVIAVVVSVKGFVVTTEVGIVVLIDVAFVVAVDVGMLVGLKVDDSVGMSVMVVRVYILVDVPELVGFAIVEVAMPTDELCLEGATDEKYGV